MYDARGRFTRCALALSGAAMMQLASCRIDEDSMLTFFQDFAHQVLAAYLF